MRKEDKVVEDGAGKKEHQNKICTEAAPSAISVEFEFPKLNSSYLVVYGSCGVSLCLCSRRKGFIVGTGSRDIRAQQARCRKWPESAKSITQIRDMQL